MLRGWIGDSRYLSKRKQLQALIRAGIDERVIYTGVNQWPAFVRALRPEGKDQAAVADLKVFGSRRALVAGAKEIAARGAVLVVVKSGTEIDVPTLIEVDATLKQWRGEATLKNPKRAAAIGQRGGFARGKKIAERRLDKEAAALIWGNLEGFPLAEDALAHMPGWTRTTAWRKFGARELKRKK